MGELCTAVEPTTKAAMCQRDAGHPLAHKAVMMDALGGTTTVEWYDVSAIRRMLRDVSK